VSGAGTSGTMGAAAGGVYLDTSALYALFDADDGAHRGAAQAWRDLINSATPLHTCNYVLLELSALLQRRLGIGAVGALETHVLPWVNVTWIDSGLHAQAVAGLLAARRRDLSLTDCASFAAMRRLGLRLAFTFDQHFAEQAFEVIP
jgi:predicted nucleic acid-binding protein